MLLIDDNEEFWNLKITNSPIRICAGTAKQFRRWVEVTLGKGIFSSLPQVKYQPPLWVFPDLCHIYFLYPVLYIYTLL